MPHSLLKTQMACDEEILKTINKSWFLGRTWIICIDGPSASGKGTLAKKLANSLGFEYLDSGLLYRSIAYSAILYFNTIKDTHLITDATSNLITSTKTIDFEYFQQDISQFLDQILDYFSQENIYLQDGCIYHQIQDKHQNITAQLRQEKIGLLASTLAKYPKVRDALLNKQREIAKTHSLVADGRDMGSVVFANADFKFFLTASLDERAWRRFCELHPDMNLDQSAIKSPEYQKVFNSIQSRDFQDQNRETAPLVAATDAILIDSEDLGVDEVFMKVLQEIANRFKINKINKINTISQSD
jgi:CMP/dCMP kinase